MRSVETVSIIIVATDGSVAPADVVTSDFAAGLVVHPDALIDYVRRIAQQLLDPHGLTLKEWRFAGERLPADRTFRDAWHDNGGKVEVHMGKAREIHRARLRRLRGAQLSELDSAYLRADEAGDKDEKKRIAARKQALRDITAHPAIDAAQTPEQLQQAALEVLG